MFKKNAVVIYVAIIILSFSGCSYIAYKDYYTKEDYSSIWELEGFRHDTEGISPLFPESIEDLDVQEFFCRYDQQLPLGEGIQVLLKIHCDIDLIVSEEDRISSIAKESNDKFNNPDFKAYSTQICNEGISEYVLINNEYQTIYYIYLQDIPKKEIEFDHELLPKEYNGYGEIIDEPN